MDRDWDADDFAQGEETSGGPVWRESTQHLHLRLGEGMQPGNPRVALYSVYSQTG